ncbi:hypothetical protein QIH85_24095 [Bradyrhizobium japonicum]|uniref:hypothetical protein n=1 Tax=Bradyrhizobium japonicum TaxID=375 RepID=UPI0027152BD2|nr:hypothetical protein [Bradyrhizobium japonicum]WLB24966.1 hypothetical protein QIH85_24095 [Bradyrhizobium japonicum]
MSIIGIGLSIGMAAMQYSAQQDMASKQQAANDAWVAYQRREANAENLRQENLRQKAEAAREGALSELTPQKQTQAQEKEQARLEKTLTPEDLANLAAGKTQSINDKLLSGQQDMADTVKTGVANRIAQAAAEARDRINALAAVQSYGGSQFGLTNRANAIFNASGQDIRLAGDERQGDLAAYQVAKAVQPIQYQMTPSPWGGAASAIAGKAGSGLGSAMAGMFAG